MIAPWLRLAYGLNILILTPVCSSLYCTKDGQAPAAMQGKYPDSPGLRMLLFSLWSTILFFSTLGLVWPRQLAGLLAFQVVYKTLYLALYAWPKFQQEGVRALPSGLIGSFLLIVIVYPVILWRSLSPP